MGSIFRSSIFSDLFLISLLLFGYFTFLISYLFTFVFSYFFPVWLSYLPPHSPCQWHTHSSYVYRTHVCWVSLPSVYPLPHLLILSTSCFYTCLVFHSSSISHPASHHPLRSVIVCKRFEREGIPSECKRTCRRFRLPMKLILVKMNSSIIFPFFKLSISTHTFCKTSSLSVDVDLTWLFPPLCFRGGRAGEAEEANRLAQKVRVLCWVMTQPASHDKKAVHVKATWGRRCNKLIFISSKNSKLYVVFYFV